MDDMTKGEENAMIEEQETQLLSSVLSHQERMRPTLEELRTHCGMSIEELSQASGVRPCLCKWMELGVAMKRSDVLRVLYVLSVRARRMYELEDAQGVQVLAEPLGGMGPPQMQAVTPVPALAPQPSLPSPARAVVSSPSPLTAASVQAVVEELENTRTAVTVVALSLRLARYHGQAVQWPELSGTCLDVLLRELRCGPYGGTLSGAAGASGEKPGGVR